MSIFNILCFSNFSHSQTPWLTHSQTTSKTNSHTHSKTHSQTSSLTHRITLSKTHSLTDNVTFSCFGHISDVCVSIWTLFIVLPLRISWDIFVFLRHGGLIFKMDLVFLYLLVWPSDLSSPTFIDDVILVYYTLISTSSMNQYIVIKKFSTCTFSRAANWLLLKVVLFLLVFFL